MTTFKCKHEISMLERETYLSHTENHIFALKTTTNMKKRLRVRTKKGRLG